MKYRSPQEFADALEQRRAGRRTVPAAISNQQLNALIASTENVLRHHARYSALLRAHDQGRRISASVQRQLIAGSVTAERSFRHASELVLGACAEYAKSITADRQALLDNFEDIRVYSNPVFLDERTRGVLTRVGTMRELRGLHAATFLHNRNAATLRRLIETVEYDKLLDLARGKLSQGAFPESAAQMRSRGVLTLEGGNAAVPTLVGLLQAAVGVLLCIGSMLVPVLWDIGEATIGDGLGLIACEWTQEFAGTQDYLWSLSIYGFDVFTFAMPHDYIEIIEPVGPRGDPRTAQMLHAYLGNTSRSKMEVHSAFCPWLHLIRPHHIRPFGTLAAAHEAGLDNCHYCVGGSTR